MPDPISGFPLTIPFPMIAQLLVPECSPEHLLVAYHREMTQNSSVFPNHLLAKAQYYDVKTWLLDDLLMKVDKMSMANSLEVRAPFLDHRLIEYSFTLPDELKIQGDIVKLLLRESFTDLLPASILNWEKHGFNLPMHIWLRGDLKELVMDTLNPNTLRQGGLLNANVMTSVLDQFINHNVPCERLVYSLYVFQQWWHALQKR